MSYFKKIRIELKGDEPGQGISLTYEFPIRTLKKAITGVGNYEEYISEQMFYLLKRLYLEQEKLWGNHETNKPLNP